MGSRTTFHPAALICVAIVIVGAMSQAQGGSPTDADRIAIFEGAGAVRQGGKWLLCAEEPMAEGANIDELRDLNGDGRPEAVVSEGGTFCNGHAGTGFVLVSRGADGRWIRINGGAGIPEFLETTGKDGWPDISIGGPGFCFPVERWNGREYALHRHEYDDKACTPNR